MVYNKLLVMPARKGEVFVGIRRRRIVRILILLLVALIIVAAITGLIIRLLTWTH